MTIPALLILALGTGATTAIFSVVDAVVLRGLPFPEYDRLVAVGERRAAPAGPTDDPDALGFVATQNYLDWAARQQVFESIAAYASGWLTLHQPGEEPESLVPERVTAHFFDVLRVRPALGRAFTPENELAGRDRVAVLSDGLWRVRFGGDPGIIGRTIVLDDVELGRGAYEVLGVMPAGFSYPVAAARATDIWVPYVVPADQRVRHDGVRTTYLQVIARLKPGVSLADAKGEMNQIAAALERENPIWNKNNRIGVRPLADHIVGGRTRSWMFMLLGAVTFVLLIACANIANLLLARAVGREREVAIRAALGASRGRLVRQLMIESLLLSLVGTLSGVVIAAWGIRILEGAIPLDVPRVTAIALNLRVLASAIGLAAMTGLGFGVVPALRLSTPNLSTALKGGDRTIAGGRRQRLRNALAIAEVALALVLLVGAALFIGSFASVMGIEPGFDTSHVLTAQISPPLPLRSVVTVTAVSDRGPAFADVAERLGRTPGILGAAATEGGVPLGSASFHTSFTIPGRIDLSDNQMVMIAKVTPDYHRVLKIPLRAGRLFEPADRQGAPDVVIISEAVAARYFPHENPVGHRIGVGGERTIVGIVGDIHHVSLEVDPRPEVYVPMAQSRALGAEVVIRTAGNPVDVVPAVRSAVLAVLPDVPLRNVLTMDERVGRLVAQRRFNMLLLGLFGILGLVIAAVGIYGLIGYLVTQRTREFGVRLALGATRARVMSMVLRQAVVLIGSGLVLGVVIAWNLRAVAKTFLFGVQSTDWRAFTIACMVLAGAAVIAAALPARRAAAVDPLVVLQAE